MTSLDLCRWSPRNQNEKKPALLRMQAFQTFEVFRFKLAPKEQASASLAVLRGVGLGHHHGTGVDHCVQLFAFFQFDQAFDTKLAHVDRRLGH